MMRTILVPLDGSPLSESVFEALSRLELPGSPRLELLRVLGATVATTFAGPGMVMPPPQVPDEVYEQERRAATSYLDALRRRLQGEGWTVDIHLFEGPPAAAILEAQKKYGADMIAMTTHGRTGLGRLVLGSVAQEVVHQSTVPVFLVRPAEGA